MYVLVRETLKVKFGKEPPPTPSWSHCIPFARFWHLKSILN